MTIRGKGMIGVRPGEELKWESWNFQELLVALSSVIAEIFTLNGAFFLIKRYRLSSSGYLYQGTLWEILFQAPSFFCPIFWRQKMHNYMDYLWWKLQLGKLQRRVPSAQNTPFFPCLKSRQISVLWHRYSTRTCRNESKGYPQIDHVLLFRMRPPRGQTL